MNHILYLNKAYLNWIWQKEWRSGMNVYGGRSIFVYFAEGKVLENTFFADYLLFEIVLLFSLMDILLKLIMKFFGFIGTFFFEFFR